MKEKVKFKNVNICVHKNKNQYFTDVIKIVFVLPQAGSKHGWNCFIWRFFIFNYCVFLLWKDSKTKYYNLWVFLRKSYLKIRITERVQDTEKGGVWSQALLIGPRHRWQWPKHFGQFPLLSQEQYQGSRLEVE